MKKLKIYSPWHNPEDAPQPKVNDEPSMTVPDQSMSIKEIQTRFAQGIPVSNLEKIGVYNGEEDFWDGRDPRTMDIVEINETIQFRKQQIAEAKTRVEKDVADRQLKAAQMKAEKEAKEIAEEVDRREKKIAELMAQRRQG